MTRASLVVILATLAAGAAAHAQTAPDYDFRWSTIGDVGNPGYDGPVRTDGFPGGRGSVGYVYRMSQLEVTTGQWLEYVNTFTTQSDSMAFFLDEPIHWGAQSDLAYHGPGRRYTFDPSFPNAAMAPVAGLSWRDAARFCNWLHGGKSSDPQSLVSGAYDTTTWGPGPTPGTYTDAERHLPGARFWIPTLDEYLKAAHFDPNKNGLGESGWWDFSNRSDVAGPLSGLPGIGESSVGTNNWRISLGAYPETHSAYGLLDLSGGAREWIEDLRPDEAFTFRYWDGPSITSSDLFIAERSADRASVFGASFPTGTSFHGLRIASIPAPSMLPTVGLGMWAMSVRRRQRCAGSAGHRKSL